jgi:kumamolisin
MFNLPELRSAYRFPPRLSGSGQCVAVIELGGGLYPKDYIEYFRTIGIPPPPLRKRTLPRAGNEPSSVEDMEELLKSIWDGDFPPPPGEIDYGALWTWETAMDLEIIGTLAPKATLLLMQGVFDDQGQYHAITSALADARNAPSVISCSWGFFEADTTPIFMPVIDRWMQSAAVLGVTACFSTGDYGDGSLGETGNDPVTLEAMFPATSPYALACGGTTLDIRAGTETAWFQRINGSAPMAAGGGFSQEFPLPAWQSDIDPDSFIPAGASSGKGRAVPDVVSRSNLDPAFSVIAAGLPFPVGGTSASAPLWAALVALLNQGLRRPTGSLNALLYDDQGLSDTFRDIVRGKIGHLRARRGWDPASGWGSPDGEAILQALRRYNR